MAYIRGASQEESTADSCLFCGLAGQPASPRTLILEKYRHCFLVLNAFPYASGHVMVAPYRHHDSFLGDGVEERAEVQAALERARRALAREYRPDGFNAGVNLGRPAGAGVVGHIHWHLVPRWLGDTNFMPVAAETRVLPEALSDTYGRLMQALGQVPDEGLAVEERGSGA